MRHQPKLLNQRILWICSLCIASGVISAFTAHALIQLIGLITNISFYGRLSTAFVSPAENHLGFWMIPIPIAGGIIVGGMARWGSKAIRGHGIPEAMEQVLRNESRIPARITWLKPLSSAIAIGTGGPFGAEGPIIATGGALGSLLGQLIHITADERKVLLAAGAAAGMAAIFAAPVSAVLLAIELLLFERRARSLAPVALATVTATSIRYQLEGDGAIFAMSNIAIPGIGAVIAYTILGGLIGLISIWISKSIYEIEDAFEKLPIHWMWWPALGGLAVGIIGYLNPHTLGVGYENIASILNGKLAMGTLIGLCLLKFISWAIALGSGTSGGTLAPLFTIGSALGAIYGIAIANWLPWLNLDPRIAALVGMAALFAGASRALLASVVFAFETTLQPHGLLPLLGGCTAAYLVSALMMRNTIMSEKLIRRGVRVPSEYSADHLERITAGEICSHEVITLQHSQSIEEVQDWLAQRSPETQHQGYPVLNEAKQIIGVVTRKDLIKSAHHTSTSIGDLITRSPLTIPESYTAREVADQMLKHNVGRMIVTKDANSNSMIGIITRSDLLSAHYKRINESSVITRHLLPKKY